MTPRWSSRMTGAVTRRQGLQYSLGLLAMTPVAVSSAACAAAKPLKGIMPIVTTPYTQSGAIDFEDLAREMRFFDRIGCTGQCGHKVPVM